MPDFTVQEKNLMLIYCTPGDSRRELLATLRQMKAQLTDEDRKQCWRQDGRRTDWPMHWEHTSKRLRLRRHGYQYRIR